MFCFLMTSTQLRNIILILNSAVIHHLIINMFSIEFYLMPSLFFQQKKLKL